MAAATDNERVDTTDTPGGAAGTRANRWIAETGGTRGPEYAERFAELARSGADVHGEASFVDRLLTRGSRVIDAGCGTGRIAIELARRGHRVAGADLDASMLAQARAAAPDLRWVEGDLLAVDPAHLGVPADCVLMAGNVMVYLTPGTEAAVVERVGGWLAPDGLLVVGFAADRHVSTGDHRAWCAAAGLTEVAAYGGWDEEPLGGGGDAAYAVLVHRR